MLTINLCWDLNGGANGRAIAWNNVILPFFPVFYHNLTCKRNTKQLTPIYREMENKQPQKARKGPFVKTVTAVSEEHHFVLDEKIFLKAI